MKHKLGIKKLISVFLSLILVLGTMSTALAAPGSFFDKGNDIEFADKSKLIASLKAGNTSPVDVYEELEDGTYLNVTKVFNAKMETAVDFIKENYGEVNSDTIDALLGDDEKLAEFNNKIQEAENSVDPEVIEKDLEVVEVSAIDTTKVVTVKATAPNAEEEATADVAIFAYDEEGVRGETAVATAADVEIVEGVIEVEFEGLETGSYVAVVTVGEEEAELDFDVDFDAADEAVDAVNAATTQIQLDAALQNEYFVDVYEEANIVAYDDRLGSDYDTVQEVIDAVVAINEEEANASEFEAIEEALNDAYPNQLTIINLLNENFNNVDSANIEAYIEAIYEAEEVELTSLTAIQEAIDGVNDQAAADAVVALIDELADVITLEDKEDVVAARAAYDALTEDQQELVAQAKVDALEAAETDIENLEAFEAAKAEVYALFVLDEEGEPKEVDGAKILADGVGSAEIEAAEAIVGKLVVKVHGDVDLDALVTSAETLFTDIQGRLKITSVSLANKLRDDGVYVLGYGVNIDVNKNGLYKVETRVGEKGIIEDTESIVIQLYKGDALLGEQTFVNYDNVKKSDKYAPGRSSIGGTIDVYGDYNSTSWDNVWYAGLTDIPDTAKAIVVYDDGRVVEDIYDFEEEGFVVNETPFFIEALNRTETVEEMSAAIIDLEEAMDNVNDFMGYSKQAKAEVAEALLNMRNAQEGIEDVPNTEGKFFTGSELSVASVVHGYVTSIAADREDFIVKINEDDATALSIVTIFDGLSNAKYIFPELAELTRKADRIAVADTILEALGEDGLNTLAEIKAAAGL